MHVHDLADFASEEGERAGASAAAFARGEMQGGSASAGEAPIEVVAGEGVRYVVPQTISHDAEGAVMLSFRVSDVIEGVRFEVRESEDAGAGEVLARARDVVAVPAEMRRMKVDAESLAGCSRIVVSAVSGLSTRRRQPWKGARDEPEDHVHPMPDGVRYERWLRRERRGHQALRATRVAAGRSMPRLRRSIRSAPCAVRYVLGGAWNR